MVLGQYIKARWYQRVLRQLIQPSKANQTHWKTEWKMVTGKLGIGEISQIPTNPIIFSDDDWGVQSPRQQGT